MGQTLACEAVLVAVKAGGTLKHRLFAGVEFHLGAVVFLLAASFRSLNSRAMCVQSSPVAHSITLENGLEDLVNNTLIYKASLSGWPR